MKSLICKSIQNKKVISFTYKGHKRIVEPFTLGQLETTSNMTLSAWWIGGYSETKKSPHWRLYTVSKMSNLTIENIDSSTYHQGYNPRDSRMSSIICTV